MKRLNITLSAKSIVMLALVLVISACATTQPTAPKRFIDTDRDRVANETDRCPHTVLGSPVDDQGCSLFKGAIKGVKFSSGSAELNEEGKDSISDLIGKLSEYPDVVLRLGGHTDNRGSARENLDLSKRRVMSVVEYMVSNGVDGNRIEPFGFGEARPLMSNLTAAGRERNRRIEISVISP